jgi:periplasmic protein TonB
MSVTTLNTFPSLHSWSSPRSWAMAIIVLLHVGFFWVLTNGMSISIPHVFEPQPIQQVPVIERPTPPPPARIEPQVKLVDPPVTYLKPEIDNLPLIEDDTPRMYVPEPTPVGSLEDHGGVAPPAPVVVEPRIDSRRALTEPYYPAGEIRQGHEGTVLLSLHILADGRVGEVRLDRSSGYQKLDESAMREAKKWRFVPGTSDGAPLAMWKQVPVTFRLNNQ